MLRGLIGFVLAVGSFWIPALADDGSPVSKATVLDATHRQTAVWKPMHAGQRIHLNTFCLDREGNILAAVGGSGFVYDQDEAASQSVNGLIQIYSPDWELKREIALDFVPTALSLDAGGYLYVGGDSVVCKLAPDGALVQRVRAPNLGDDESMRAKAESMLASQREQMTRSMESTLKMIRKTVETKKKEAQEDSGAEGDEGKQEGEGDDEAQQAEVESPNNPFQQMPLEQLETILKSYEEMQAQQAAQFEPTEERIESVIRSMGRITSIAAGDQDVFVVCAAATGFGYDVWRMNRDLQEPVLVKERLSGCCGQLDIQAQGERLIVAENTKFRVAIYDRDGQPVSTFGKQDRRGETGFGSCCNPMNTRCDENGEILTAESSIGTIKRFDAEGNLIATIGRAKIGGGCKHVALGFDRHRDRYYMMFEDDSSICVLEPWSADRAETEEERLAREAAEGLGKVLVGNWKVVASDDGEPPAKARNRGNTLADFYGFSQATFAANGDLATENNSTRRATTDQTMKWIPVAQHEQELVVAVEIDLVSSYSLAIQFENERRAEIFLQLDARASQPISLGVFEKIEE